MEEYKIRGWVARDADGYLNSGVNKPQRIENYWGGFLELIELNPYFFPDLKWEDEPIEVECLIRKIEHKK